MTSTSVRTVLDRTGLYRQAFYDNFADKDACYLAAFERGRAGSKRVVISAAASEEIWRGKLRAGLGALLDLLDAEPDFGRGVIVEVHAAGPEALARRAEAMKRVGRFHRFGTAGGGRGRVASADRPGGHRRRHPRDRPFAALHRGYRRLPRSCCRSSCTSRCCPTSGPTRPAPRCRPRGSSDRAAVGQVAGPALHWDGDGFAIHFESRSRRSTATGCPARTSIRSQRERLLEAMVRVAAAKGYEATTVADVIEYRRRLARDLRRDVRRQGGLLPRGLRRGLRRARRPCDQRLRGGRRASPGRSRSPPGSGPGRAAGRRGRHRADGDGRGDRRRRRRPRALPGGAGPLHPLPRGGPRLLGPGRGAAAPTPRASRSAAPPR